MAKKMAPGTSLGLLLISVFFYKVDSRPLVVWDNTGHWDENDWDNWMDWNVKTEENGTFLTIEDFMWYSGAPSILGPTVDPDWYDQEEFFEGDIAGIWNIQEYIRENNQKARNAVKHKYLVWPDGVIPYQVSNQFSAEERRWIAKAFQEFHDKTCIRFVPRKKAENEDYIFIKSTGRGCFSSIGKWGGKQDLSLDSKCFSPGTVMHELMHTMGFFHEHSRNDRDGWIQILWENMKEKRKSNFDKFSLDKITHLAEPYDYASIMHYSAMAFSKNRKPTIIPKRDGADKMGQRVALSETDVRKINKLYRCRHFKRACVDKNPACGTWRDEGDCQKEQFKAFTAHFCQKSCGHCWQPDLPKFKCVDQRPQCKRWAIKDDLCFKDDLIEYFKVYCRKSCDWCRFNDEGSTKEPLPTEEVYKITQYAEHS